MGALYDGADGTERGSAAEVAKLLGVPVIVVLDVWGMTRTAAAILEGLRAFDPDVRIAGCVLNRVGSEAHTKMIVGRCPRICARSWSVRSRGAGAGDPERHLGLVTVEENSAAAADSAKGASGAGRRLDGDRLITITGVGRPQRAAPGAAGTQRERAQPCARLAIARDRAFCFYYEENLLPARGGGIRARSLQPDADPSLPPGIDAVYSAVATPRASPPS